MNEILIKAFENPNSKFCYFTGQNDAKISELLGIEQWDWTPQKTINLEPYYWNTHTIPLSFGCKQVFTSEGNEWIEHLITDPSQVHEINIPNIYEGRTGEILNLAKKLVKENSRDALIRLPDIQSPLGVCELMWDQSFYIALLTNIDEVKILLEKITKFIIDYIKEFQKILGDRYNPCCHPQIWSNSHGYYISDDANSMVSPEMHLELSIEYINRITDQCGPVFYHSCTVTEPYIDNIKKVKNMKLMNWSLGTSMDPAKIIETFSGDVLLAPHLGKDVHTEELFGNLEPRFENEYDVVNYLLSSMKENTTMNIVFHESIFEDNTLFKKIYQLLHEKGFTPPR